MQKWSISLQGLLRTLQIILKLFFLEGISVKVINRRYFNRVDSFLQLLQGLKLLEGYLTSFLLNSINETMLTEVNMHFLLKDLKAIIHSIKLAKSVLWEEHILHDSEVSIKGKHALSILEPIDPFIDF